MSEIHALSGAYAVDALDDLERAQFERHLAGCESCRSEVASLREASALLAETTLAAPSPALRDRVLAEIATVRPLPPVAGLDVGEPDADADAAPAATEADPVVTPLEPRRRRRVATFLATAAAAVTVVAGGIVWQLSDGPDSRTEQVLQASDAETFTETLPNGATATVVRSEQLNEAVLITEDMPPAPEGHAYALWLQQGDDMVPAGTMPDGADNKVLLTGDAASADGAGITVETAGEEHPEPEGSVVVLFDFAQA